MQTATVTKCPQCGAAIEQGTATCKYCGEALPQQQTAQPQYVQQPQAPYGQPTVIIQQQASTYDPNWPIRSKIAAGLLGIILGGIGAHKFYLGKSGLGILYLLLCWTGIPSCIGFIEGIVYLTSSDHVFQIKNQVRIV